MSILGTLAHWARDAWGAITGAAADVAGGFEKVWHYITSVYNTLGSIVGGVQLRAVLRFLYAISALHAAQGLISDALHRLAVWIYLNWIKPAIDRLTRQLVQLRAYTEREFALMFRLMVQMFNQAEAYTRMMVGFERSQRIAADKAEHAAMLKAVAACLATVQRQAAGGYNAGTHARLSIVGKLLDDIAARQPEVKALTSLLIRSVFDLETIDNPLLRFTIGKLLSELVGRLGVDRVTGDLIGRLLEPWIGDVRPRDLYSTERDVAARLSALEAQWADFMANGGPEVEQAGREWRDITGVAADVAILGVFGLAVADPQAWARGVADTVGAAGNATLDGVIRLIREA